MKNPLYKGEWYGGTPPIMISVPPLVEPDMWEMAQRQSQKNMNNAQRNTKNNYLLRSSMTCVQCGYHFHGFPHSQTGKLYYRCGGQTLQNSPDYSGGICHGYLIGEDVDNLIWGVIANILKCPDLILEQFERQQGLEAEETRNVANFISYCAEQITSLESQQGKLLDLYLTDKIPHNLFEEKRLSLDEQLANLQKKYAELQERLAEVNTVPDNYGDRVKSFCNAAQIGIDNFTAEDKRAVVEMLDIHVYVKRGKTRKDDTFELTGFIPQVEIDSTSF